MTEDDDGATVLTSHFARISMSMCNGCTLIQDGKINSASLIFQGSENKIWETNLGEINMNYTRKIHVQETRKLRGNGEDWRKNLMCEKKERSSKSKKSPERGRYRNYWRGRNPRHRRCAMILRIRNLPRKTGPGISIWPRYP